MKRTPMPPRAKPMPRGKLLAPGKPLARTGSLTQAAGLQRKAATTQRKQRTTGTGFPPAMRMVIRTRAGHGDPENAVCECCGRWLGRYGGQCHHRLGRQSGGSRRRNRLSNALLACGTPFTLCHGEATAFRQHMKDKGFVLNSGQDPAAVAVRLYGGTRLVWLDDEGGYLLAAPRGVAA